MNPMKTLVMILMILPLVIFAQIEITSHKENKDQFPVVDSELAAAIIDDAGDAKVVNHVAHLFADDIKNVTGKAPSVRATDDQVKGVVIIIGTIGKNELIDQLIADGRLKVDDVKGKWECFSVQTIKSPTRDISKALIIAGSDRRETAYGAFTLSEKMGVSPWYRWADIPFI